MTYRAPFGKNILKMPLPLLEALCSPADTCLLARRDVMTFLRDVQRGSLGPNDKEHVEKLLCLIEDALGFQVFESIEQAKKDLSSAEDAVIRFDYPTIDIEERVSRAEFGQFTAGQVDAIFRALDETLEKSGLLASEIDLVCSTGGTARVPAIARGLETRFGTDKMVRLRSLHSVISGLAERARDYV